MTSNDLWPCHVTSKCVITWRFPLCIYDPSLVVIGANLFMQEQFEKGHATITITIWRQITNNLTSNDLWPCHVTSKSVITWRFPLCTLVYLWSKFGCNWRLKIWKRLTKITITIWPPMTFDLVMWPRRAS